MVDLSGVVESIWISVFAGEAHDVVSSVSPKTVASDCDNGLRLDIKRGRARHQTRQEGEAPLCAACGVIRCGGYGLTTIRPPLST